MPEDKTNNEQDETVSLASLVMNQKPSEFKDEVISRLNDNIKQKISDHRPVVASQVFNGEGGDE